MDYYMFGVICGVTAAIIIALCIKLLLKKKSAPRKYDERQLVAQGTAYRWGFFTSLILSSFSAILSDLGFLPGSALLWQIGSMLTSVGVFAVIAICNDAYLGFNETPKRFIRMGIFFCVALGLLGIVNTFGFNRDSNNTVGITNLMVALLWLVILIVFSVHNAAAKKDSEDEE